MEHLGALNAFVQTADCGSFAGAAARLGVSGSAIGKAVARLEERLAVRLFHRSTRSLTLTAEGALFLDRCRRIFSEIEAAELELSQIRQAPRGRLRVSLPLIGMLMMPAVMAFMRAYPEIELDLDFTDRLVDVIDEGFDAVVRTGEAQDSRLMMRRAGAFSHRIVGSPDYLAARGVPSTPDDLLGHACHHHKYPSTGKLERWPMVADGAALELVLPVTSVASTLEPQICLAEEASGLHACRNSRSGSSSGEVGWSACLRTICKRSVPSTSSGRQTGIPRRRCPPSSPLWLKTFCVSNIGDLSFARSHHASRP